MGHLGRATAVFARALGLRVVGICRKADDQAAAEFADEVVSSTELDSVLGRLDFLAICLPATEATRGLFGPDQIKALKHGAIVINAAREVIVDYPSLVDGIKSGRIAAAALDVFEKEPLKRWSPLWKLENVLITPHIGALTKSYKTKVSGLVCDNIDRFRSGQPLGGVVDRAKGY